MCVTEKCNRVRLDKNLSDMFPIRDGLKQGDPHSPLFSTLLYITPLGGVQVDRDGLKLSGTNQLLVYADDVNILGPSVHTIKENVEALIVASKGTGLEVNADKTTDIVMSRVQNAGRRNRMKIDNSSFERGGRFKIFGTTFTNQNSTQEEIKSRLNSGNTCYHSVQNLLSSSLISKNLKITVYRTCFVWV